MRVIWCTVSAFAPRSGLVVSGAGKAGNCRRDHRNRAFHQASSRETYAGAAIAGANRESTSGRGPARSDSIFSQRDSGRPEGRAATTSSGGILLVSRKEKQMRVLYAGQR